VSNFQSVWIHFLEQNWKEKIHKTDKCIGDYKERRETTERNRVEIKEKETKKM
jgi:hypothetical protein